MNRLTKVVVSIPTRLFEMGLTEAEVHGFVNRWLVISLFLQEKLTATEAGQLLTTDRDGFLSMLDQQGILYDIPASEDHPARTSPTLKQLAENQCKILTLEEELAEVKYQLYNTRKQLQEADKITSEFLATVSHELRTPLNSIIGFAKLLLNQKIGSLNKIQHKDLVIIYTSAQHLLSLVNDILDFSKIEAGKIRLNMEWVRVQEIIVGVMASALMLIEGKAIELEEHIESGLGKIYVDRGRIRQVIINILSNAAKFTDKGKIIMRFYQIEKDGRPFICCSISDTGIGIAPEDKNKVFEAFRQIDSSIARRAEGTGLGMSISRRLVRLHGGDMWFKSTIGQGSTFFFTIPLQPPQSFQAEVIHIGMDG